MVLFELYKENSRRTFRSVTNISFLVAGTLIVLITTLFMNAGSEINKASESYANHVVMNTIISSASAGLYIVIGE